MFFLTYDIIIESIIQIIYDIELIYDDFLSDILYKSKYEFIIVLYISKYQILKIYY